MRARFAIPALCLVLAAPLVRAAEPFASYEAFRSELLRVTALPTASERTRAVDALWRRLRSLDQIPYRQGDRVAFLYLDRAGSATEVAWRGDMTDWDLVGSHLGRRLGDSRVWWVEDSLPEESRIDYKIFLDGSEWILDPDNPRTQVGGFGPNSELRMPRWVAPEEILDPAGVPRGRLGSYRRHTSAIVQDYVVTYRVYTPPGYAGGQDPYPVVWVTDGQDYSDPEMGRMTEVLDNRIADGTLPPLLAVFLDPRDPQDDRNRREWEYAEHPELYARILVEELVPAVDSAYRTMPAARHRMVVGTSFGGLFALYVAARHSGTFGGALVQSPALEYDEFVQGSRIRDEVRGTANGKTRVFLDVGTMHDGLERARALRGELESAGFGVRAVEVPEGHSWGHWRAWIDDGVRYGLGKD